VLLGLKEQGWDVTEDLVKASTSFGGGVALSKNICGCLSAAAMGMGLKFGTTEPTGTAPRPAYARTNAILERFRERFGTTQCGDLTAQWVDDFAHPDRAYKCGELVQFTLDQLRVVAAHTDESSDWEEAWWDDYLTRRDKIT
jgi:C_GCAxxG_C_C family probable redox protein|tara:strand:+ start:277 stop:702 length:426 start_codon:yes stop_codon:yes gene_type:complete